MLCERTHAEPVQCIGRRFVIYRESREHKHIELAVTAIGACSRGGRAVERDRFGGSSHHAASFCVI